MKKKTKSTHFQFGELTLIKTDRVPQPVFQIRDLAVTVRGTKILKALSLGINEGCITSIVGPSGCGKSTFLLTLSGLLPLTIQANISGSVIYRRRELFSDPETVSQIRKEVGIVFQAPTPFPISIYKNLELPLKEHGISSRRVRQDKIELALKNVNLWSEVENRLHRPALSLSVGQQQRLCLARALILEPKTLLMDEPTSALDPLTTEIIEDFIKNSSSRLTVVLVTHNLAQARRLSDYVALFWPDQKSTLIESGEAEQLFKSPSQDITRNYLMRESSIAKGGKNA